MSEKLFKSLDAYLEMTGQKEDDVFSGQIQYGPQYVSDLLDQAVKERKKIKWVPEITDGEDLGLGRYELDAL